MQNEDSQTAGILARNLLCYASGKSQEQILADREMYASEAVCEAMEAATQRLLKGEPLAYILGEWEFYGLRLVVDRHVLIPRDDTCAVTSLAIHQALFLKESPRILDLCTGSGCIGLAIASRVKDAKVTLADISKEALNVSNPPYITSEEMKQLPESVADFEPHLALHGGEDGLTFYRAIIENYTDSLKPGGYLCFEFGMGQGDAVCQLLQQKGYTILERSRDYNDRERAVIAQYGRKE